MATRYFNVKPLKKKKHQLEEISYIARHDKDKADMIRFFGPIGFQCTVMMRKFNPIYMRLKMLFANEKQKKHINEFLSRTFLAFYPEPAITDMMGEVTYWSSYSTRYKRDNWSNSEGMKIMFDYVLYDAYDLIFIQRNSIVMRLDPRILSSARIVVISDSEHDRKPFAEIFFDPANSYTYAEWKDKRYMAEVRPIRETLKENESYIKHFAKTHSSEKQENVKVEIK